MHHPVCGVISKGDEVSKLVFSAKCFNLKAAGPTTFRRAIYCFNFFAMALNEVPKQLLPVAYVLASWHDLVQSRPL